MNGIHAEWTQQERLLFLLQVLAEERFVHDERIASGKRFISGKRGELPEGYARQRQMLRGLMNLRPPLPIGPDWLRVQDAFLQEEAREKGIVDGMALPEVPRHPGLCLWRGDITRLRVDAIVNAANSALLGCFYPNHGCIDNAIHSAAGIQLRQACRDLMERQGHEEPAGGAKLTPGFNLPAAHVLHTVGPIVRGEPTDRDCALLAGCYRSCLRAAAGAGCQSVAFCCISTEEFRFPNRRAAEIAVAEVSGALAEYPGIKRVIFNVFKEEDDDLYRELLA